MLIAPDMVVKLLGEKEFASLLNSGFPSLPERTRRRFLRRGAIPQKKTLKKVVDDLSGHGWLDESVILDLLKSDSPYMWRFCFDGFRKGAGDGFAESFEYAFGRICHIEKAVVQARVSKGSGDSLWFYDYKMADLPLSVLSDHFFDTLLRHWGGDGVDGEDRLVVSQVVAKAFLRISLYCLAAVEVGFVNSGQVYKEAGPWVHRFLPSYNEKGKLIGPMRCYFEAMMRYYNDSSLAEFACILPSLSNVTPDLETQRRMLLRWCAGQDVPSWESMRMIKDELFEQNVDFLAQYAVVRFLQAIFNKFRCHADTLYLMSEQELVSIFQEYSRWQDDHRQSFAKWAEARGC